MASNAPEQTNGISLLPVLTGEIQASHKFLNWEFFKPDSKTEIFRQAVRIGKFKSVRYGAESKIELYDLSKDISESTDIADHFPDMVSKANEIFEEERDESLHYPYGGYVN